MTIKLRKLSKADTAVRLAVSVKSSTSQNIDIYKEMYEKQYGEPIERSQLVDEMLRDFMNSDKGFQKYLTERAPKSGG
ncbi:DUF2274 domain-containing protein [Nostoc sp. CHAB 5834]|nr:DUF2274 domain-containing protein [Nostoc sp. CHAB 5834]